MKCYDAIQLQIMHEHGMSAFLSGSMPKMYTLTSLKTRLNGISKDWCQVKGVARFYSYAYTAADKAFGQF